MSEGPPSSELHDEDQSAGYEGWGDYMETKKAKLLEQQREGIQLLSTIFEGMSFHVNGLTSPGLPELRQMVLENGGQYQQYFRAGVIMVATHLPEAKIKKLSKEMVVVRPEWLVDCAREGRLLEMDPYRLYAKNENSSTLAQFIRQPREAEGRRLKTSASPNFVQDFYQSSRLHHLSRWRSELKAYAAQLMAAKPTVGPDESTEHALKEYVMHVDMDCFFVSVSARGRADLEGRAVAVSHSAAGGLQEGSSSDLASVNYEARAFGLSNGMYARRAMQLCPSLVILPYDFEAYHAVSLQLYEILAEEAIAGGGDLEAISCDEAMLWIALPSDEAATHLAARLRARIRALCQCSASIGIGSNKLIARLATKRAKPDGLHLVDEDRLEEFMAGQRVGDLPGIGRSLEARLTANGWHTCADLWPVPLEPLQTLFGPRLGENIYEACRGQDPHPPAPQAGQKSVGSEISWGVRFETASERDAFIADLVGEVMARQHAIAKVGQKLHVKLYARKAGAGEPHKRLGRGDCDVFNKTVPLGMARYTSDTILKEVIKVIESLNVATVDIRGIGVFFSALKDSAELDKEPAYDWNMLGAKKPRAAELDEAELCNFLLAHGVEPSVYKELPESVQKELLADLNTIDDQAPVQQVRAVPAKRPTKAAKASPKKDSASMSLTQFFGIRKGGPAESKKSKTEKTAGVIDLTSAGIDAEFFNALPSYLQEEIIEDHRRKSGQCVQTRSTTETTQPEPEHQLIDITEEAFGEAAVLSHAKRLLAAGNYEQLSRDLSRLRHRFPAEMEPVLAQIQELFHRHEGSSLYIP